MKELLVRLEKIAALNDDEFEFGIEVTLKRGEPQFRFSCWESADSHEFVSGTGSTCDAAVEAATKEIPEALEAWGYSE